MLVAGKVTDGVLEAYELVKLVKGNVVDVELKDVDVEEAIDAVLDEVEELCWEVVVTGTLDLTVVAEPVLTLLVTEDFVDFVFEDLDPLLDVVDTVEVVDEAFPDEDLVDLDFVVLALEEVALVDVDFTTELVFECVVLAFDGHGVGISRQEQADAPAVPSVHAGANGIAVPVVRAVVALSNASQ